MNTARTVMSRIAEPGRYGDDRHKSGCYLQHPHNYFRCSGEIKTYLRKYKSPVFGWSEQDIDVCNAHKPTLGDRYSGGELDIYTEEVTEEIQPKSTIKKDKR